AQAYVTRLDQREPIARRIRAIFNAPERAEAQRLLAEAVAQWRSDAPKLADWAEAALLVESVLALPVDLYGLLEVRLLEVEDARRQRFLLERWKEDDTGLSNWLQARERLNQEGVFPWPFRGPYRVLGEAHLPQEKLPQLWAKEGFYGQG
ncbi:MAG: hypothetical protein N2557_08415, partial [Hydrogenophilus sp.]|nr:hypothetical protein [Hydrogenophilus sp.]